MIINNKKYGEYEKVYFIAEIGLNHNGSIEIAKDLIQEAAKYGADAVKFQKRDPKKLWTKEYLNTPYYNEYSFGKTYGEHKAFLEFNNEQYYELKKTAEKHNIDFLVSAFDTENLIFTINELKVPAIKIPSPFVTHIPYLNFASKSELPVFLSTGMHTIEEIDRAIGILKKNDANFVLMQCTSLYPAKDEKINLRILKTYQKRYRCKIGYSGHDNSVIIPAIAATLGAVVIEKHITLDRAMKGPDHAASLETRGLELTIKYIKSALASLGSSEKEILDEEWNIRKKYCFSLKAKNDIRIGDIFSEENLILKSPRLEGTREYFDLLGDKSKKNYKKDEDIL